MLLTGGTGARQSWVGTDDLSSVRCRGSGLDVGITGVWVAVRMGGVGAR